MSISGDGSSPACVDAAGRNGARPRPQGGACERSRRGWRVPVGSWRIARLDRAGSRGGRPLLAKPRRWRCGRRRATAWQISKALKMPRSTVTRILDRAGLNRVTNLDTPLPVRRYEWANAGDLSHMDLKRLGRIAGVGHRIHGDRRARGRGIGWEFLHVAIDDATRLAYVEVGAADTGDACAAFLERALTWFSAVRHSNQTTADGQRICLSRPRGGPRLPPLGGAPSLHAPLSAADQRKSGAPDSNALA
jgi:hypothetical protein